MAERRAKIVCTLGPASGSREVVRSLLRGGMDVARLNFSHGDHASHGRLLRLVRSEAARLGRPVAVLQDLQGIKIRTGPVDGGGMTLRRGSSVTIRQGSGLCRDGVVFVSHPSLIKDARRGDRVLLDDGLMELSVTGKSGDSLRARVVEGGVLTGRKGVNLPAMRLSASPFTAKDARDLAFGIEHGVDYVAVSFVRTAGDLRKAAARIKRSRKDIPLIAKIETPAAVENIEAILEAADGIMVARGDLGVEVPPEEVPLLQKMLIELANHRGKLVITATQMLESMTRHLRPTRAEAADVANAVIDGTDALMLSAETSAGNYPAKALAMMDRIVRKTESGVRAEASYVHGGSYSEAVAEAAVEAAEDIGARYIVAFTHSGYTARLVGKFRPATPVLAFAPSREVVRRMSLYWGVRPMHMRQLRSTDAVFREVDRVLLREGLARRGQSIVVTASTPIGGAGKTNFLKLHRVGG